MERLTLIIGMSNPHSSHPRMALAPWPRGVAGYNLWRMARDVCGVSRAQYMRTLDRVNLCPTPEWDLTVARAAAEALLPSLEGRRVILLGRSVLSAFRVTDDSMLRWHSMDGMLWCHLPHPSGLNRVYNSALMRYVVGLRLEAEIHRGCAILGETPPDPPLDRDPEPLGTC